MTALPEITTTIEGAPYQVGHLKYLLEYCRSATRYSPLAHSLLDFLAKGEALGMLYRPYGDFDYDSIRSPLATDILATIAPSVLKTPNYLPPTDRELHAPPIQVITSDMVENPYALQLAGLPPSPLIYSLWRDLYRVIDTPAIDLAISYVQYALAYPLTLQVDPPVMSWCAKRWTAGGWDGYEDHMANQAMDTAYAQPILTPQTYASTNTLFGTLRSRYFSAHINTHSLAELGFEPLLLASNSNLSLGHSIESQSTPGGTYGEVSQNSQLTTGDGTPIITSTSYFNADRRSWSTPPDLSLEQLHHHILNHQTPTLISATQSLRTSWTDTLSSLDTSTRKAFDPAFVLTEYWALASMNAQTAQIHALLHPPLAK